jgi:O-antigen ligase
LLVIPFLFFLTSSHELAEMIGVNTYYPRLSAWSTNPNQLAMFLLPIPIWLMAINRDADWKGATLLRNFLFLFVFFLFGVSVRSDALLLAWCIGLPALTFAASRWMKPFNWKMFATLLAALFLAFSAFKFIIDGPALTALSNSKSDSVLGIRKSDSVLGVGLDENKGGVRKTLWIHAAESWMQSPIIGHGPGAFSYLDKPEDKQEAHNLAFDMLTQVGIAGTLLFGALYLWLLVKTYQARDPYTLAVLIVITVFSGAHFMLRQPVFSLYLIICALAVKNGSFTAVREKSQPL